MSNHGALISREMTEAYSILTTAEKLLAVYEIYTAIKSKYVNLEDLNSIDLAFIISNLDYDMVKIKIKNHGEDDPENGEIIDLCKLGSES